MEPSKDLESVSDLPADMEPSDDDLQIDYSEVLKSVSPLHPEPNVFESIECEIEKQLTDKAEKSHLTVFNVKRIIREVLTNEHMKALLDHGTEEQAKKDLSSFGPKLTRAKAKELLASNDIPVAQVNIPWVPAPPPSETRVLIGDDLREDDSGDEYLPEESEDDKEGSVASVSDISSLPPPTPPTPVCMEDLATQISTYTEDGVFKIPPTKPAQEDVATETANIALRTRSKINLSSTPLEVIEKNFVPPDVTTDMYDMECDDDEWRDFLQGFAEPLEEVVKNTEDEEHDPEYNIMADDQINKLDNEDFRVDKAVKITKKEVKELYEELFEYLNSLSEEYEGTTTENNNQLNEIIEHSYEELENSVVTADLPVELNAEQNETLIDINIEQQQIHIMEQQMRQHVQMLTQNFFLTYEHPEYHSCSEKIKEYLLNLKFLAEGKQLSMFRPINLPPALNLIEKWIDLCATNNETVRQCREHVQQQLLKSIECTMAGNGTYILTFPKLILETISSSEVFLYPALLPKIPFKSAQFSTVRPRFTDGEDCLLAFGLHEFKEFLMNEKRKPPTLKEIVLYVKAFMMPHKEAHVIMKHISQTKHPRCATNPIQQYMLHNRLKPMVHRICPLNGSLPPCKRPREELPYQWRTYIYPDEPTSVPKNVSIKPEFVIPQIIVIIAPPQVNPTVSSQFVWANSPILPRPHRKPSRSRKSTRKCLLKGLTRKQVSNVKRGSNATHSPNRNISTTEYLVSIFLRPIPVQKLVRLLTQIDERERKQPEHSFRQFKSSACSSNMSDLLGTPSDACKAHLDESAESRTKSSETAPPRTSTMVEEHKKPDTILTNATGEDNKRLKLVRNLEFSTVMSSSFQKLNTSSEVEFCRNASDMPVCQTSQCDETDAVACGENSQPVDAEKDNPEALNELSLASSTLKPDVKANARRKISTAERKKNKLRKEFLTNLSIATPDSPDNERHKSEMFAAAYFEKIRETLEREDYHRFMHVLNDFGSGDVIDLYNDVQSILLPKYTELAEDFLFFLREKEAATVGKLIPWLQVQTRVKFLRKLEVCLKDQPAQLKRVYNTLMELSKTENINMEKIKSALVPMLKGNKILLDLLLQNFKDEPPPPSLLEGPYETIDLNKELARSDNEELYETLVVPNTEDKYGGLNCICHCHRIEDNEYKSRYKHCNSCGLKFANGKLYLSAGRVFQPATVTFKTNPHFNHNARLMGKSNQQSVSFGHKKKRSDVSPNKLAGSSAKENLEEDTEDEEFGKRKKTLSRTPRKRRKLTSPKKSPARCSDLSDSAKHNIKSRKRTNSGKKSKKEEEKKVDFEVESKPDQIAAQENESVKVDEENFEIVAELDESEHETSEEQQEKLAEYCMDSSGESLEKPLTPEQHTAESETEIDLEESSQDNYESDDSSSSTESTKGSQSDSNTNDEPAWLREEDTIILETIQKEDDKEYALQIISDKMPNRTVAQIRNRLSRLVNLLIETLKNN